MNLEDLRKERLAQRKARNQVAVSVLGLILGEIENQMKVDPKVDVYGKIRKVISNNNDTLALKDSSGLREENKYLESLLPKELSEKEILEIMDNNLVNSMKDGMYILKTQYAGQYNGKTASKVLKEFLAA